MPCQYGWAAIPMKTSTPFLIHAHSNFLNLIPKTLAPHQQSLHSSPETMIKLNPSHTPSLSSPFPLQFPTHTSLSLTPISNFNFPRLPLLRPCQKPKSKDVELLVETCITRTLPPALTLEHGLQMIKDAVDELKSNPPRFNSGMYRFQVAVPPSAKALNWFCCQPESLGVFPQFFLSKEKDDPTFRSLSLSGVRGVFGIGTAVLFKGSSSCASAEWSSIKRLFYPYCCLRFYELEGISNLAATLVWDDSSLCTFEEAVQSYELALYQVFQGSNLSVILSLLYFRFN
ncbi:hypothetical protein CsSME_00037095 [Camellia sinensis var. sinensis]